MSMEPGIYNLILHRIAQRDHGWGKPYDFAAIYVLNHAVLNVERSDSSDMYLADEPAFDEALKSALRESCVDLPSLTFVDDFLEVYDPQRKGPVQVRDGGGYVALGPIFTDADSATVGAMFFGGGLWARWLRYHLRREGEEWRIVSCELLALS